MSGGTVDLTVNVNSAQPVMKRDDTINALATMIAGAQNVVVLTGARLGAPEGSEAATRTSEWTSRASLEAVLTNPADFWAFFRPHAERIAAREPGNGHRALARLQTAGHIGAIITQSVDRLHHRVRQDERAEIVEVHGNVQTVRCDRCGEVYALGELASLVRGAVDAVPRCTTPRCSYPLRPGVTLWGESLIPEAAARAWELAARADCFVIVDSELRTTPMSLLPSVPLTRGASIAMIGTVVTQYDRYAQIVLREPSATVLAALAALLDPPEMRSSS